MLFESKRFVIDLNRILGLKIVEMELEIINVTLLLCCLPNFTFSKKIKKFTYRGLEISKESSNNPHHNSIKKTISIDDCIGHNKDYHYIKHTNYFLTKNVKTIR